MLIMPPNNVCPQCQAVVPPRQALQSHDQDRKFRVPLHYCAEGLALQCFLVNPRRACAARVTVVGSVCQSVCPCFNSPLDCLFVPQTIPSTARVTTISSIEPFFLNMLRCRDLSAATTVCIQTVGHFLLAENVHAHYFYHVVEVAFFSLERKKMF